MSADEPAWDVIYYHTAGGLFCLLEEGTAEELAQRGLSRPAIAVIDGRRKPARTAIPEQDYAAVRELGEDHKRQFPRRIMEPDPADRTIASVAVSSDRVTITTESGAEHSIGLFGRLIGANQIARDTWTLSGDGRTVHWPIVNEHCSKARSRPSVPARCLDRTCRVR